MLIADHGLQAWLASWQAGTGVRGASGLPMETIIERADARLISLGARID